jgi:hypothetical protein
MRNLEGKNNWQAHLDSAILALRLGMEGMAGDRMARFIDALAPRLSLSAPAATQRLNPLLGEALAAQGRKDFQRMADLLQYEIKPLLDRSGDT